MKRHRLLRPISQIWKWITNSVRFTQRHISPSRPSSESFSSDSMEGFWKERQWTCRLMDASNLLHSCLESRLTRFFPESGPMESFWQDDCNNCDAQIRQRSRQKCFPYFVDANRVWFWQQRSPSRFLCKIVERLLQPFYRWCTLAYWSAFYRATSADAKSSSLIQSKMRLHWYHVRYKDVQPKSVEIIHSASLIVQLQHN